MSPSTNPGPAVLRDLAFGVHVVFLGREATAANSDSTLAALAITDDLRRRAAKLEGCPVTLARNRQIHSDRVVRADPGREQEADGLWTDEPGLGLAVFTADCVPVLLVDHTSSRIGAIHAGWRGLASGIVLGGCAATRSGNGGMTAWIGPHIGPCCYEVSWEVLFAVAGARSPALASTSARGGAALARPGVGARPHLDLGLAARRQLLAAGVADIRHFGRCTRCEPGWWSYRADGPGAGRNFALIWRENPRGDRSAARS